MVITITILASYTPSGGTALKDKRPGRVDASSCATLIPIDSLISTNSLERRSPAQISALLRVTFYDGSAEVPD